MAQQKTKQSIPLGHKPTRITSVISGLISAAAIIGPFWLSWALDDWGGATPPPISFYAYPILIVGLPFLIASVYLWRLADRTKKKSR